VLEGYTTEVQRYDVRLLWAEEVNAKDIHKEIFPVYDWRFTTGSRKVAKCSVDDEEVETEVRKWLRLYAAGFEALGRVYQCWWRIYREVNVFFFQVRIAIMFYVLYPLHKN
jgi:hypothetical protein